MQIWYRSLSLDLLNERSKNTMAEFLDIEFTAIGDDYLKAIMPVNERTTQPMGIVHGGANVVLAETLASTAANSVIDFASFYCVGLEINANHIHAVRQAQITGITSPLHLGKSTQVWQIKIFDSQEKLSCVARMTAAVIKRKI